MQSHRHLMPEKIEARAIHRFPAAPERVFDAFIRPDLARRWRQVWLNLDGGSGTITQFRYDARMGGSYAIEGVRAGRKSRSWGRFLALDRPFHLTYTLIVHPTEEDDPSIVDITIEPDTQGGCVVTLCNELGDEWSDWLLQIERTWTNMLLAIDQVLGESA